LEKGVEKVGQYQNIFKKYQKISRRYKKELQKVLKNTQ